MNSHIQNEIRFHSSLMSYLRLAIFSVFYILFVFALCPNFVQAASPGALDLSFGNVGVITEDSDGVITRLTAMQVDGKMISIGNTSQPNRDFLIRRYNSDGSIDNSFGTNGIVITDFDGQEDFARSVELLSDGKILVGGFGELSDESEVFKIARYLSNGSLDTSFGTNGKAIASFSGYVFDFYSGMTVQPDGKIVITSNDFGTDSIVISRLDSNGSIDSTFGNNGLVVLQDFSVGRSHEITEVQSNGKIIVVGQKDISTNSLTVYRLNTDGSNDNSFGVNGEFTVDELTAGRPKISNPQILIQPDDKIIVSGVFAASGSELIESSPPLVRINADGTADSSFNQTTSIESFQKCNSCTSEVKNILLRPDGKFYLVGLSGDTDYRGHIGGLSITSYNSDGSIDKSFSFNGTHYVKKVRTSHSFSIGKAMLQSDGKILISARGTVDFGSSESRIIRLNATKTPAATRSDFDGDGKTDFAVFRPNEGNWYVYNSSDNSVSITPWGTSSQVLVPGDYNYDRKTDFATFSGGTRWWVLPSQPGSGNFTTNYGVSDDVAVPGDYDGDGLTDIANYRPSDGNWYLRYSSHNHDINLSLHLGVVPFGLSDDIPVQGDYDGDGRTDVAMYRPSSGVWYILRSSDNEVEFIQWGISTDIPVQSDFDGDGKTDVAVFRDGVWYVRNSSDGSPYILQFGLSDDIAVPGDYDGDSKTDIAVFRPNEGNWYVYKSSDLGYIIIKWGQDGDIPIPSR